MTDRFLARAWWLATMSLITLMISLTLISIYRGVFQTLAGAYIGGAVYLSVCIPMGIGAYLLCKYRGDLVCD